MVLLLNFLEEYKETGNEDCIREFIDEIWSSDLKPIFKTSHRRFNYDLSVFGDRQDLIDFFEKYRKLKYKSYESYFKDGKHSSKDYLYKSILNTYIRYFEDGIYLSKEYYKLLNSPNALYISMITGNVDIDSFNISEFEENYNRKLEELKNIKFNGFENKKITFEEYKKILEPFFYTAFKNFKDPFEAWNNGEEIIMDARKLISHKSMDVPVVAYFSKTIRTSFKTYMYTVNNLHRCDIGGDTNFHKRDYSLHPINYIISRKTNEIYFKYDYENISNAFTKKQKEFIESIQYELDNKNYNAFSFANQTGRLKVNAVYFSKKLSKSRNSINAMCDCIAKRIM